LKDAICGIERNIKGPAFANTRNVVYRALRQMKKNYPDMHILDETDKYFIGHIYEDAYLIEKRNGEEIFHDDFYGDPTCGLISKTNEWAIIAGEHITIWKNGRTIKIDNEEIKSVHAVRTRDSQIIEILIDPWTDKGSIWTFDTRNFELKKLKDFHDYKGKERNDDVVW